VFAAGSSPHPIRVEFQFCGFEFFYQLDLPAFRSFDRGFKQPPAPPLD